MSMTVTCAACKSPLEVSDATVEELKEEFGHVPRRLKHVVCPPDEPELIRFVTEVRIYGGDKAPVTLDPTDELVPADPDALLTGFRVEVEAEDFDDALAKLAPKLAPHWDQLQKNAELLTDAVLAQQEPVVEVDGG